MTRAYRLLHTWSWRPAAWLKRRQEIPYLGPTSRWGSTGSGDGQFNDPEGVAADGSGNVYVADYINNRIQKFACP